jgi:hypothetical protein
MFRRSELHLQGAYNAKFKTKYQATSDLFMVPQSVGSIDDTLYTYMIHDKLYI